MIVKQLEKEVEDDVIVVKASHKERVFTKLAIMKRIHTQAKKDNRRSWFSKQHGKTQSANREAQRIDMQPERPRTFGQMIHHVQRIQREAFIGVRRVVTKDITHAVVEA